MLLLPTFLLITFLFIYKNTKGPMWAFCIGWLISITPIAFGIASYSFLDELNGWFGIVLSLYLLAFITGIVVFDSFSTQVVAKSPINSGHFHSSKRLATITSVIGLIGTLSLIIDFVMTGQSMTDMVALREFQSIRDANWLLRLGSVTTWGCLYSGMFGLVFAKRLTRLQLLFYTTPIAGYFLVSVLSAGRQAAFQIAIFALFAFLTDRTFIGTRNTRRTQISQFLAVAGLVMSMTAYMGYVAIARNDAVISYDKVEVLQRLFDFTLASTSNQILEIFGDGVRTTAVEALVYFSSPIALFSVFLSYEWPTNTYGAMSLPLLMRQVQFITGISVWDTYSAKVATMSSLGVIGVGWTTGISNYILDFGRIGGGLVLLVQGAYSAYTWRKWRERGYFNDHLIAITMLTGAIYLPMVPITSDTNLLLLWLFCILTGRDRHHAQCRSPAKIYRSTSRKNALS